MATLLIFWDPKIKVAISWCFFDACRLWGYWKKQNSAKYCTKYDLEVKLTKALANRPMKCNWDCRLTDSTQKNRPMTALQRQREREEKKRKKAEKAQERKKKKERDKGICIIVRGGLSGPFNFPVYFVFGIEFTTWNVLWIPFFNTFEFIPKKYLQKYWKQLCNVRFSLFSCRSK